MTDGLPTDLELARQWRDERADPDKRHRELPMGEVYAWELLNETLNNADDLEAIVRDLAGREPVEENDLGIGGCSLCDGYVHFRIRRPGDRPDADHDDDCPWRRAVEWVEAHPEWVDVTDRVVHGSVQGQPGRPIEGGG